MPLVMAMAVVLGCGLATKTHLRDAQNGDALSAIAGAVSAQPRDCAGSHCTRGHAALSCLVIAALLGILGCCCCAADAGVGRGATARMRCSGDLQPPRRCPVAQVHEEIPVARMRGAADARARESGSGAAVWMRARHDLAPCHPSRRGRSRSAFVRTARRHCSCTIPCVALARARAVVVLMRGGGTDPRWALHARGGRLL